MKKNLAPLIIALGLTACATKLSPEMIQVLSCDAYASTLTALAGYRAQGLLTPDNIALVDHYRPLLNMACTSPATGTDVLNQIEQGVIALNGLKNGVTR